MKAGKLIFAFVFVIALAVQGTVTIIAGAPNIVQALQANQGVMPPSMVKALNDTVFYDMPGRTTLLNAHATAQNMLQKNESGGFSVVRANDDNYVNGNVPEWTQDSIEACAVKLHDLQGVLDESGSNAKVIFMNTQPQVIGGYTESISGYPLGDANTPENAMLYYLERYGVDYLDVRTALNNSDLEPSQYKFRTDYKWTIEASLEAKQALRGKIVDQYGVESAGTYSYDTEVYEDAYLGALGQATGKDFTGLEDFTAIIPTTDSVFTYEAQGSVGSVELQGSFEETLFNEDTIYLDESQTYGAYSSYLGGGQYYWRKFVNDNPPSDAKVLFVHDENTLPLGALLAPDCAEVHMYFPEIARSDFEFNVVDYVEENDIDFVVFQSDLSGYSPFGSTVFGFGL